MTNIQNSRYSNIEPEWNTTTLIDTRDGITNGIIRLNHKPLIAWTVQAKQWNFTIWDNENPIEHTLDEMRLHPLAQQALTAMREYKQSGCM